uniref:Putative lipocalin-3 1 n=1 Tax=Amblyomma triste TaxID=251400 RepID=A0A023GD39_AMBTT
MAALFILQGLLLAFLVVTAFTETEVETEKQDNDFTKILQKDNVIWVYNTTEPENITCRKDKISDVNQGNVSFHRYFWNGTQKLQESLRGELFNWVHWKDNNYTPYDAMSIYNGTDLKSEEKLQYISDDGTCAVVTVMIISDFIGGKPVGWTDLRLTDSVVGAGPSPNCSEKFDIIVNVTKKPWRQAYFSYCQS